jgi:AraC-like DNA-binding protein
MLFLHSARVRFEKRFHVAAATIGLTIGAVPFYVLIRRFRRYLSDTPMAYLTRWRLQLGAQLLASTSNSVAQIAAEAGYESEPSFNRAFKREFSLPPARFRSRSKSARSHLPHIDD